MVDSVFSSEKRVLVTLPECGFARLVDLDLTVQYDGRQYNLLVRACVEGGVPGLVSACVTDPMAAWVVATAYCTAEKLCKDIELPRGAVPEILGVLETDLGDSLGVWLKDTQGRILQPERRPTPTVEMAAAEKPTPLVQVNGDVLVMIERDVSGIFNEKEGSFIVEYTLFNEPSVYRCILALHKGTVVKVLDYQKKSVGEIIRHLHSDALAFEIASYFGGTDSHQIHLVSAVLKLGFAFHTRPPNPLVIPSPEAVPEPSETVTLPSLKPISRETVTVFNGGYFEVRA